MPTIAHTFLSCAEETLGVLEVVGILAGDNGDGGVAGHVRDPLHLDPGPLAHNRVTNHLLYSKGTVSRDLRWVLQYINQKLFSRAIVAHHKILI